MRRDLPVRKPFQVAQMMLCLVFGMYAAGCATQLGRNAPVQAPEARPDAAERDENTTQSDGELTGGPADPADPADLAAETSTPDPPAEPTWGYRVQLYSFTNRDLAEAAVKQVERTLAEWSYGVYLNEESERFKVRVGDFVDKADADRLRDSLRSKGFPDAWTARALIQAH